jgi:RHS repeat-associated protein
MPGRNYQNTLGVPYAYQGQEKDAETNLLNFELRQYDARLGRWYNPDPMGQHHSPYLAMSNNPVSSIDPDGGQDYYVDDMKVSEMAYNQIAGSGNVQSLSYGGMGYGSELGASYDGQMYLGKNGVNNAYGARDKANRDFANNLMNSQGYLKEGNEYYGGYTQYGSFNGKNGNVVLDKDGQAGNFGIMTYSMDEIYEYYGMEKPKTRYASSGIPIQDIDMGQSAKQRALYKQYGRNFNDLADFSEKAVIGTFAGAGVLMTGGTIMIVYGGVEGGAAAATSAVVGSKATPALVKAIVGACFVQGTQILTDKGLKNIEDIKVNDVVFAYDIKNGKTVTKRVLTTFEREVNRLIKLEYGDEIVYTTSEHPFYINNSWVKAGELKIGDLFLLNDKSSLPLRHITVIDSIGKVYNFEVENEHNYYVGKNSVLVHNSCSPQWVYGAFKSAQKWAGQLAKRGWTPAQITEAITSGKQFSAVNMVNKANSATRYVHPVTGRSVVVDNVTRELLQVGGDGFLW